MLHPELFVPKARLELPLYESSEVAIEMLSASELIVIPVDAIAIMRSHFNGLPEWRKWPDGRGATIHLTSPDGKDIPWACMSREGIQEGAFSTDGYIVHDGDQLIVTYGVKIGEDSGIFWGISSQPVQESLASPQQTEIRNIIDTDPGTLAYYSHHFPAAI